MRALVEREIALSPSEHRVAPFANTVGVDLINTSGRQSLDTRDRRRAADRALHGKKLGDGVRVRPPGNTPVAEKRKDLPGESHFSAGVPHMKRKARMMVCNKCQSVGPTVVNRDSEKTIRPRERVKAPIHRKSEGKLGEVCVRVAIRKLVRIEHSADGYGDNPSIGAFGAAADIVGVCSSA
jgi:hypothetical protein